MLRYSLLPAECCKLYLWKWKNGPQPGLCHLEWNHLQTITIVVTVINNCSKQLAASNVNTPRFIVSRILLNTLHFSIFFEHYPTQLLRFLFDYGWYN